MGLRTRATLFSPRRGRAVSKRSGRVPVEGWDTAYEHGNDLIVRMKVGNHEPPLLAELRLADAATAASHEGDLALQPEIHYLLPLIIIRSAYREAGKVLLTPDGLSFHQGQCQPMPPR